MIFRLNNTELFLKTWQTFILIQWVNERHPISTQNGYSPFAFLFDKRTIPMIHANKSIWMMTLYASAAETYN